jgi:hypothetical protein
MPEGIFQWRVNVLGLTNASQQFQQMMNDRLKQVESTTSPFIYEIVTGTRAEPGEDLHAKHFAEICRVLKILEMITLSRIQRSSNYL